MRSFAAIGVEFPMQSPRADDRPDLAILRRVGAPIVERVALVVVPAMQLA
jgi:hypothetical protein